MSLVDEVVGGRKKLTPSDGLDALKAEIVRLEQQLKEATEKISALMKTEPFCWQEILNDEDDLNLWVSISLKDFLGFNLTQRHRDKGKEMRNTIATNLPGFCTYHALFERLGGPFENVVPTEDEKKLYGQAVLKIDGSPAHEFRQLRDDLDLTAQVREVRRYTGGKTFVRFEFKRLKNSGEWGLPLQLMVLFGRNQRILAYTVLQDRGILTDGARFALTRKRYKWNSYLETDDAAEALRFLKRTKAGEIAVGDTALNQLGLSTQVPANWQYLSDGPYRRYVFHKGNIVFRHSANRLLGNLSREAALVVQALRALGQEHVTRETISRLAARFDAKIWRTVAAESRTAPDWIREVIAKVMEVCHE